MNLRSNNIKNITLCGMMGSGKSVVGKNLASKINYVFVDVDKLIEEKLGKSISKIFDDDGEEHFRMMEEKLTLDTLKKQKHVISLGGGAIENFSIRNSIKENALSIYLEVDINILTKRLANSKNRPLIKNRNIKQTLFDLLVKRKNYYNEADLIINNNSNIKKVVDTIDNYIRKND